MYFTEEEVNYPLDFFKQSFFKDLVFSGKFIFHSTQLNEAININDYLKDDDPRQEMQIEESTIKDGD